MPIEPSVPSEAALSQVRSESTRSTPSHRWQLWTAGAIALFAILAFAPTLNYEFVFDDRIVVIENHYIQNWDSIPQFFTTHIFSDLHPTVQRNYYRPVWYLVLLFQHSIFGLHPAGWHAITVLLHTVATVLLFFLTLRLFSSPSAAVLTALVFGLHPAHIEAVAWVSGSAEPLAAAFVFGAALTHLAALDRDRAGTRPPLGLVALAWTLAACAFLSKEGAVVLPVLILCLEFAASRRDETLPVATHQSRLARLAIRLLPYFAILLIYLLLRIVVLGRIAAPASGMTISEWLLTLPGIFARYLQISLAPTGLSAFYDVTVVSTATSPAFWLPLLLLLGLAAAAAFVLRKNRFGLFACFWFLIALVPALYLRALPAGELLHDRYLYLPLTGICWLVALGLLHLEESLRRRAPAFSRFTWGLLGILVVALLSLTWAQLSPWKNNYALFSHGVQVAPRNNLAANNLALELHARGDTQRAIAMLQEVLKRDSSYWLAAYNLGYLHYQSGQPAAAEAPLRLATQLNPQDADGLALLARALFRLGRIEEGVQAIQRAIALRPRAPGYHFALGVMLREAGQREAAARALRQELEIQPDSEPARRLLAELESAPSAPRPSR